MKEFLQKIHWSIFTVMIIAVLMRIPHLNGSFWLDEAAQALESARPLSQQLQLRDDFQPPLLHLLVHFELLFSKSEWWLRTGAALIPGLITIWAVYKIGQKVANTKVGLMAAVLLATSSFHLFYSQELRPYALPAMFASLSWFVLIKLMGQKGKPKLFSKESIIFAGLSALGLYTSYLYPFLLLAQLIYVFIFRKKFSLPILVGAMLSGITFLPWLPSFLGQLSAGQSLRTDLPGWQEVVSFNQLKSLLLIFGKFTFGVLDLQINAIFLIVTFFILGSMFFLFVWKFQQQKTEKFIFQPFTLFLAWALSPIILAWIISFFVPVLQPKRVLYSLPAFYLSVSWLVDAGFKQLGFKKERTVSAALFGGLLLLNIYSSASYYFIPKYQREDWRGIHAAILQKYPLGGSIVAFAFPAPFAPWQWYDDGKFPTYSTGVLTTDSVTELTESKQLTQYRFVLVFDYLRDLTDPQNKVLKQLNEYGYHEVDRITPDTPLGFVRVYSKTENVIGLLK